ncbi:cytochrome c5 [Acidovorax sp. 93]|uniref:c-type cytochrome n=1 Tax=Acidovorax sp. 93 TaxID=2135632 RepID=UPI0008CA2ADC|nr:c-type cytochrome [Acidovorax sp. 93]OGB06215.1 MAG: cytochrome C [Burkholderiales bacterium RIFCSPHIGHO2_02_FULL_64_19]OGB12858.1 MAG: cytochrome C [Burkholderiales bacterium RIFCSPHIGHO2_12_FULL_65_48]OGB52192.1 MAG: cytochrome C [Burkholderiales bacterium RIFCSPLOWO2_12_FULL_64_33]RKR28339.1 cytochrome c5 [Acidovorax sp. 93]
MSDNHHEEAHTGPIKNPKQLLVAVLFSFVIPIFAIIGLVLYVTSADKPAAGAVNPEKAIAERIQKVGMVEIRDANRPLRAGEEVYKGQCAACHATGAAGAPKFADAGAWTARIATGFETLVQSALKGKGAMAPQGGGDFNDTEIARAVAYMANAAGAKFAEPAAPAAAGAAPAAAEAAPAAPATPVTAAAPAAEAAPAAAAPVAAAAAAGAGEALYKQACQVCHAAGVAGAPKFGDKAAWSARLPAGIDALYNSVAKGKGAMPPRGGAAQASDADLRAAVEFMAAAAK